MLLDTDYRFPTQHQNITFSDIDLTTQDQYNFGGHRGKIDNADVIELALDGGTNLFQIGRKPNYSPLSGSIGMNDVTRFPKHLPKYQIPLSGQQNVDEMLARKQQQRGYQNKQSIDGFVRSTKNCYTKYFNEELNENVHRVWWSEEAQDIETTWD